MGEDDFVDELIEDLGAECNFGHNKRKRKLKKKRI